MIEALERLLGKAWPVLERAEESLAEGVVVRDTRATEGRDDAEPLERDQQVPDLQGPARVAGWRAGAILSVPLTTVQFGAKWCAMVQRRKKAGEGTTRSFTVRLDEHDYHALVALGERHKPPLKLQYLVNFAIVRLLRDAQDPQHALRLGDPLSRGDREP